MSENKIRIYNPLKNRFINVNEYGLAAKKLYRLYIDELDTPAENILPQGLKYNQETGYFTKSKTLKEKIIYSKVEKYTYIKDFSTDAQQKRIPSIVKNILSKHKGKSIKVMTFRNGEVFNEGVIDIPNSYASWWKSSGFFRSYLMVDSDFNIFSKEENLIDPMADEGDNNYNVLKDKKNQGTLIIDILKKVKAQKYAQSFLDGINHCFFTPIKSWAEGCLEDAKSKTAEKRYKSYVNKINNYLNIYNTGLPEDKIQEVCDDLQISIEVDLPSLYDKKVKLLNYQSNKKPLKIFRFINTRIDHVEINDVKSLDTFEEVEDKYAMADIEKKLQDEGQFYFYKYNDGYPSKIYTFDKIYKLVDDYSEIVSKFQEDNNLDKYKIDHLKTTDLSRFCLAAVKTNGTIDFVKNIHKIKKEEVHHIDMKRAYTKSKDCPYYKGILGKITDFRKTDKIMGTGLYEIENIKINNPMFKKLNFIFNYNIYTNAELEYYKDNGVEYDIVGGCWGSTIDLDFGKGEEDDTGMYSRVGEEGPRVYCKWYGCLTLHDLNNKFRFYTSSEKFTELYNHALDNDYYGNIYYQEETPYSDAFGVIEYKKRQVFHQAQIASFIVAYQRISILEQLKNIDIKNVVRVCVDGIYFKGDKVPLTKNFNYKPNKTFENEAGQEYCVNHYDYGLKYDYDAYNFDSMPRINNQYEFHKGPGGTGKTHYNLTDKGLVNVLFVAPSWKLARRKQADYGCDSTTFYHILTADPDVWRKIEKKYSVLVIDEVSMLSNYNKNLIINRYRDHKIIFCGDVNYQLDPVYSPYEVEKDLVGNFLPTYLKYYFNDNGKNINSWLGNQNILMDNSLQEGIMKKELIEIPTIEHNIMHRCKCPLLKQNLLMLREIIGKRAIDRISEKELNNLINGKFQEKENIDYKIEDYIITNTHKKKDVYSEKYKDILKYYVKQNTRDYCNGMIVFNEKPIGAQSEIRHGYTIHSLQGETALSKLFIDINGIKSIKMLYTAISRAQYWHQVVFIK